MGDREYISIATMATHLVTGPMQFGLRAQPIFTLAMFSFSIYFKKLQKRLRTRSKAYVTME
jgi:hypothetical protein